MANMWTTLAIALGVLALATGAESAGLASSSLIFTGNSSTLLITTSAGKTIQTLTLPAGSGTIAASTVSADKYAIVVTTQGELPNSQSQSIRGGTVYLFVVDISQAGSAKVVDDFFVPGIGDGCSIGSVINRKTAFQPRPSTIAAGRPSTNGNVGISIPLDCAGPCTVNGVNDTGIVNSSIGKYIYVPGSKAGNGKLLQQSTITIANVETPQTGCFSGSGVQLAAMAQFGATTYVAGVSAGNYFGGYPVMYKIANGKLHPQFYFNVGKDGANKRVCDSMAILSATIAVGSCGIDSTDLYRLQLNKAAVKYGNTALTQSSYDNYLSLGAVSQVGHVFAIRSQAEGNSPPATVTVQEFAKGPGRTATTVTTLDFQYQYVSVVA